MGTRIFISYRTADGMDKATALSRDLGRLFGAGAVFLDKDDLRGGSDWRAEIGRTLQGRPILLLLLTPLLIEAKADDGRLRIAEPTDPVRRELEAAFEAGAHVIPVVCDGLGTPLDTTTLPPPFQRLDALTWRKLRAYDWVHDVERLAADLRALGVQAQPAAAVAGEPADAVMHPPPVPARRRGPGVLGAVAALVAAAALASWAWWTWRGQAELRGAPAASAERSAAPPRAGPLPATGANGPAGDAALPKVSLAGPADLAFGRIRPSTYSVLGLQPERAPSGDGRLWRLRMQVRLSAAPGSGGMNFWDSSFRLLVDGVPRAPDSGLNEVVDSGASKDGVLTWDVPHGTRTLALRVHHYSEVGEVPLALSGGAPAPVPAATVAGPAVLSLDAPAEVQFNKPSPVTFTILDLASRPLRSGVYGLQVRVRMALPAHAVAANFGSHQFRLLVDGTARAPDTDLNAVVEGASARDAEIGFEVPTSAQSLALQIQWAEGAVADLPMRRQQRP